MDDFFLERLEKYDALLPRDVGQDTHASDYVPPPKEIPANRNGRRFVGFEIEIPSECMHSFYHEVVESKEEVKEERWFWLSVWPTFPMYNTGQIVFNSGMPSHAAAVFLHEWPPLMMLRIHFEDFGFTDHTKLHLECYFARFRQPETAEYAAWKRCHAAIVTMDPPRKPLPQLGCGCGQHNFFKTEATGQKCVDRPYEPSLQYKLLF